ncbi:MAG: hypothetical protein Q9169_007814 [Polycauliona sp. 2 TL-2023]
MLVASAVNALNTRGDLMPAFVNSRPGSLGHCDSERLGKLTTSFKEAIQAIEQATKAIDNLKKHRNLVIGQDKKRTWNRQAQLMKALFNIDVGNKLAQNDAGATSVREKFQSMLDAIDYQQQNVAWRYWVFCSDNWLQWKTAADVWELDDQNPKRTLGQRYGHGGYRADVSAPSKTLDDYIFLRVQQHTPFCRGLQKACTLIRWGIITFCEPSFAGTLLPLAATKSGIRPGDRLDDKMTLAHLWIHELAHLINNFVDENTVDENGNDRNVHANGWLKGVTLARWNPDRARKAPDLYALFATAVYFDNFGWATGVAEV